MIRHFPQAAEYLPHSHRLRPSAGALGPANPAQINLTQEPLDFRREGLSPSLSLLMSAFSLVIPPGSVALSLRRHTQRSATVRLLEPEASVHGLSPVKFSAQDSLSIPMSCYAFFK